MLLEKTLRYLVIAGIFTLPFVCLLVTTSLFFPYITGKNFAFRIIVEIITGASLALALVDPKYRPRRSWILGAFAVFVLVIAIADAFGAYPFKSFWSNYERMDGWVTLAHLLLYLFVAAAIMNTEKLWRGLFRVSLGVSVFISIYGLLQVAGISALGQGGLAGLGARVDATFGNPIYLAIYMLFHISIAALLIAQSGKEQWNSTERTIIAVFLAVISAISASLLKDAGWAPYLVLIVFDAIAAYLIFLRQAYLLSFIIALNTLIFFFTGTRGTVIGLIGGTILALLIAAFLEGSRRIRLVAVFSIIGIIVLGGVLKLEKDTAFVKSVGFLDRLATISATDSTVKARFLNMGIAWQGVKERPIFGWGQENYAIVFDKYYDPRMYGQEPWFDRVHNSIFDWLIAGGFVGLIAYLSIFAATLWVLWRSDAFILAERCILTGLLAGYFFHNLFVFDNITSYILFASVLAYIAWRASTVSRAALIIERRLFPRSALPYVAAALALLVWGGAWFTNTAALAQNRTLLSAITQHQGGIQKNLELFKQAVAYGSFGTQEVREQLAQGASQVASAQGVSAEVKQQFFDTATHEMTLQAAASPLDARFPLFLGIIYNSYGDYVDGGKAFEKAHELSPRKQTILFQLGQNQELRGNFAGALNTYKLAYDLDPNVSEARIMYAAALIRAGDDTRADEVLAPLIPSGAAADLRIAAAYVSRKHYDKIAGIWEARVKASPQDIQGYFTLAAAYYGGGLSALAIDALKRAVAASPAAQSDAEALIQQIKDGTAQIGQ
ncbi:hypothetical protein A2851_02245 [Candidatus Kaiserbacteria bacterium RIFCSPHIGHO2_01_FULL_53_29]|uniref:O-antigen ligase-related domain-containing protein n=1 Tax=Candidatus Kaiserbacteria bacterium RIFCSPHIGHO2_01_FULL_53_29 TaxID=1798480 RepID=A0A1F6CWZ5_9BACT|nr:MAG: hypothetical protein A2851_02245 [Candidatus Kaiserbacteria bacterium RIFCSPHIGHO2_01_FULL_53_29]